MSSFHLLATAKLGLESLVKDELKKLGFLEVKVKNGEVEFKGDERAIVRANLWLRTAERVFVVLREFPATTFDEIYEETLKVDWPKVLPENAFMHVNAKCVLSKILSRQSSQSIVKKAIVERMKQEYKAEWFSEEGPEFNIHFEVMKDQARLMLDSSGVGLHKRGYRAEGGVAPLRETMAAAMVMLSNWKPDTPLFDPLCGSGTIAIETALIGQNRAPGLHRTFESEKWPMIDKKIWEEEREKAKQSIHNTPFIIEASDNDEKIISTAKSNSKKAGVGDLIHFTKKDLKDFTSETDSGIVITNPPYGERLNDIRGAEKLYQLMGHVFERKKKWTYHILSPHPQFEKFFGRKSFRNRKVYNGKIRCYLYSFA